MTRAIATAFDGAPRIWQEELRVRRLTLAIEGDPRIRRVELRNGVLVITDAAAAGPTHIRVTRQELAAFVLGDRSASTGDALTQLDRVLDRSHLMPPGAVESAMKGMKATGDFEH